EPVWMAAARSLGYAAVAATVAVAIGAALAVAIARSRRGTWIDALSMAPLGVSSVVVGLGALLALRQPILGIDLAATGVLVPAAQAVVATPLVVRALVPAVRAVDGRLR